MSLTRRRNRPLCSGSTEVMAQALLPDNSSAEQTSSSPQALRIERLVKRYGQFVAVDDVSLAVERGDFFGFLGPNGAGKTTTINAVVGLATLTSGRIEIFGYDNVREWRAGAAADRTGAAGVQLRPLLIHSRRADLSGRLLRSARPCRARPRGRAARKVRSRLESERNVHSAVGRHEAALDARARADPRAAAVDPRRADGRRRRRAAHRTVGVAARTQRGRDDDHLDDPLPRRSRIALQEHCDHRRRQDRRDGVDGQTARAARDGDVARHRRPSARVAVAAACGARRALRCADAHAAIRRDRAFGDRRRRLADLQSDGYTIEDVDFTRSSLQDVFLDLVRR